MARKDTLISIAIILCCIGLTTAYIFTNKAKNKEIANSVNEFSPEYSKHRSYLFDVSLKNSSDLPDGWLGYFGSTIPVVKEQDFPWFAQKLKNAFRAASGSPLYHEIIVGGMNALDIDQPLLEASKRNRPSRRPNIEIVIVAPTRISNNTKQTLEKRGLIITLIENQQE